MIALLLGCLGGTDAGAGVPSALHGDWYGADGRRLAVQSHALGDFQASSLDGTWANDTFLFASTAFDNRGTQVLCEGSLALDGGALVVDIGGSCDELSGRYSRTPDAAEPPGKTKAPKKKDTTRIGPSAPPPKAAPQAAPPVDQCERYVDCVCDIAIEIRHRGNDDSYMISCDTARIMADIGTAPDDCQQALVDMEPWFQGIEAVYPRVEIPSDCRNP